jgi:hypothetical protein
VAVAEVVQVGLALYGAGTAPGLPMTPEQRAYITPLAGQTLSLRSFFSGFKAASVQGAPVSMLTDILRGGGGGALGGLLGAVIPGVGVTAGQQLGAYLGSAYARPAALTASPVASSMAALPALGGVAVAGGRMIVAGARAIQSSAVTYCRRHPQWCSTIGGTAAVAAMIQGGQLPAIRRRRSRGISPSDFKGFRRVHKILSGFCAPRMRVRKGAKCR